MGTETLYTAKKAPINGHGDTLHCQKGQKYRHGDILNSQEGH